jgi:hypothetical protein
VNPYTPSFVLAALLSVTPALAAPPAPSALPASSASLLAVSTGASETSAYAHSTSAPSGTGRLFAGGYLGLLANEGVAPNLGVQVAGPIRLAGLPPTIHLEWTGALDLWFRSDSEGAGGIEVDASAFNIGVIPGARIVFPIAREVLLTGDLGVGLALTHTSVSSSGFGNNFDASDTDFGVVFRLAAGAIIPLSEKLRLEVAPLGLQMYAPGGTAFSMRVGLAFALD